MVVRIAGQRMYLWRAVDHEGEVLDMLGSAPARWSGGAAANAQAAQGTRALDVRDVLPAERDQLFGKCGVGLDAGHRLHDGLDLLPKIGVGHAEYRRVGDKGNPASIDVEEQLPRLPTGKLYKRLLRDRYWGGRPSRIV
jgi:hypothetical protein